MSTIFLSAFYSQLLYVENGNQTAKLENPCAVITKPNDLYPEQQMGTKNEEKNPHQPVCFPNIENKKTV